MHLVFSGYTGDQSKLTKEDKECLTPAADLWIELPLSAPKETGKKRNNHENLRAIMASTYPGAVRLHEFATASVKATGMYPTSKVMRTPAEDQEDDGVEELLAFDEPHIKVASTAKGDKILLKPTPIKRGVGQGEPRRTLRNPFRGRVMPARMRAMSVNTGNTERPIYDVVDETPLKGCDNNQVGFEPRNIKDAQAHETWPLWKAAMEKEASGLLNKGTWTEVRRHQVQAGVKIMGSQFIFKDKPITGAKARLVVRGDQQSPKPTKDKTFSPTPSATEFRTLCALATENNQPMHSCDIVQAFTQ